MNGGHLWENCSHSICNDVLSFEFCEDDALADGTKKIGKRE